MALAVEICNFEINIFHNHLFENAKTQDMEEIYLLQQIIAFADQQSSRFTGQKSPPFADHKITPFADQQLQDGRTLID